jgi:hypothetical protein
VTKFELRSNLQKAICFFSERHKEIPCLINSHNLKEILVQTLMFSKKMNFF